MTMARALVEADEGQVLEVEGRSAAKAAASRSHVPDALAFSMHSMARVEVAGLEENVDPCAQTGAHELHGPALTKDARQEASEMKGLAVPTVLQSAPKAPATQAQTAAEAPLPGACVQKPWPLHGSNAHAASHVVAVLDDVWIVAGHTSPAPTGVVVTARLRVYCRGASAGAAAVAGAGLPQGPTTQLRDDCATKIAFMRIAWGCPDVV